MEDQDRPFMFVVADGAASSKGGAGWCYWWEGRYYDGYFWAGRQATNLVELLAIHLALLNAPYGADVLLWTDSRFAADVLAGRAPVARPDLRDLRRIILEHNVLLDLHVTIELVKSERNQIHSFVDHRARQAAQMANLEHAQSEIQEKGGA